jgi:hypothetical protein
VPFVLPCSAGYLPAYLPAALEWAVSRQRDQLLFEQPDWDFQLFTSQHLAAYLEMTRDFMKEYFPEHQGQQQPPLS